MGILVTSRRHDDILQHTKIKHINKRHDVFRRQRHGASVQSKLDMLLDEFKTTESVKTLLKLYAKGLMSYVWGKHKPKISLLHLIRPLHFEFFFLEILYIFTISL